MSVNKFSRLVTLPDIRIPSSEKSISGKIKKIYKSFLLRRLTFLPPFIVKIYKFTAVPFYKSEY